jgi:head-tail adaptor
MEVTEHTHKILMRFIPIDIDATYQIRYMGRVFEVIGAPSNWMERNIQWQFNVKEVFDADNYQH